MIDLSNTLHNVANQLEGINKILADTQGEYITFEEAVAIATIIYGISTNSVIEDIPNAAERDPQYLLAAAHDAIKEVEHYRACPCKVDFKHVYQKKIKPLVKDYQDFQQNVNYYLRKIRDEVVDLNYNRGICSNNPKTEELDKYLANYENASKQEAKARLEYNIATSRYKFMEAVSPDVIDLFVSKVEEISRGVISAMEARGVILTDHSNENMNEDCDEG